MDSTKILQGIIILIEDDKFSDAQQDCRLLPQEQEVINLCATIGAIDSQPTEQAYRGTKSAALGMADKLIGHI